METDLRICGKPAGDPAAGRKADSAVYRRRGILFEKGWRARKMQGTGRCGRDSVSYTHLDVYKRQGVSDVRVDLVNYAKQFLGNPYVWGGTSLTNGADCSGFVQSVFKNYGVSLPRTSAAQSAVGTKVSLSEAQPGDLIFYANNGRVNHVAIYIGGCQVIHASNARTGIKISNASYRTPYAVKRVLSS